MSIHAHPTVTYPRSPLHLTEKKRQKEKESEREEEERHRNKTYKPTTKNLEKAHFGMIKQTLFYMCNLFNVY